MIMTRKTVFKGIISVAFATAVVGTASFVDNISDDFGVATQTVSADEVNGFVKVDSGYKYYSKGQLVTNSWVSEWGNNYYVGNDGLAVKGVQHIDDKYYYFGDDGTFYMRKSQWVSQWGNQYYVGSDGVMVKGIQHIDNNYYYFGDDGTFYLRKNQWVSQWGNQYYAGADGKFYNDVKKIGDTYYSFDRSGYFMIKNQYVQSSWGDWYMFGNDGKIVTGWKDWQGSTYYFNPSTYLKVTGTQIINGKTYNFDSSGKLIASANYNHSQATTVNTYPKGNCTYYAKQQVEYIGNGWGNASEWANSARKYGYTVDHNPAVGTVVVFQGGQGGASTQYGHVAVVRQVSGNSIFIEEMNGFAGFGNVGTRWVTSASSYEYIH